MPFTALPKLLRCPQGTVCWAAVLLLSCHLGSRLKRGRRSQTPSPRRRCEARHVSFRRPHHSRWRPTSLAGTLYLPLSGQPAPAVVFVHGAGPAVRGDRYHELARHFARNGVAALIYDKRGCGASTGDWTRAGLYDLAEDALACVRLLRGRQDINPTQVGLWGLSQGASIIPIAASRSPEVAFVIAVGGCLDFEGQCATYRANLFRRLGHPSTALDIANKTFLIQVDLSNRIRSGSLPAPRAWRDSCRFEFDLDQAAVWRQVRQPILAIYGERDRHVPLAESSARLATAVERVRQPGLHPDHLPRREPLHRQDADRRVGREVDRLRPRVSGGHDRLGPATGRRGQEVRRVAAAGPGRGVGPTLRRRTVRPAQVVRQRPGPGHPVHRLCSGFSRRRGGRDRPLGPWVAPRPDPDQHQAEEMAERRWRPL